MPGLSRRLRYWLGRAFSHFWRFKSLAFSEWLFRSVGEPCVLTRRLFGYHFSVDVSRTVTHRLLYLEGERMVGERRLVTSLIEPGMRIVDVGANIGYYLLMFERALGGDGEIVCFEPEPSNLAELKRNIARNAFTNVVLHEAAVGEHEGRAGLKAGINSRVVAEGEGDYSVPVLSLASAIPDRVDMIKIDVDGYEAHVLLGAKELLARDRPRMFLEFHPHHIHKSGYSFDHVYDVLTACYDDMCCYEMPEKPGSCAKIGERYFGRDPVRRIDDSEKLIEDTRSGRRQRTFWIVCR